MDIKLKQNCNNEKCKKAVGEAQFTIILPKADNSNNQIKKDLIFKYADKIGVRFGGTTTKPVTLGCWRDEERGKIQCESGVAIETFRDFDSDDKMQNFNSEERKVQLEKDFNFMNRMAKESAIEFGQDSVPVIFDNISDASLNKGEWTQKINKSKLTGKKVSDDLWNKYI